MNEPFPPSKPNRGRISEGPTDIFVERTLEFVRRELATWRDDPERSDEDAEENLNAQFCKFLNDAAPERFPMVFFHHEEKQAPRRRIDVSALRRGGAFVSGTYHTKYDPFLVFEGKRLPAPRIDRKREYVTGGIHKSGGIQRFKLGLHGSEQMTAAMIGYVQAGELEEWHEEINRWIRELAMTDPNDEQWSDHDQLSDLADDKVQSTGTTSSVHKRVGDLPEIVIRHLWVRMAR